MRFRVWMDHAESDCHTWASDLSHSDLDEARRECEMLQDTTDGYAEYTVINLRTGFPYYLDPEEAVKMGFPKRGVS
jgi:hypothetical protein